MFLPPVLVWLALSVSDASEVVVSGERWASLQRPRDVLDSPAAFAHTAEVELARSESTVRFRAEYGLRVPSAGWVTLVVAPADAHLTRVELNGQAVPTTLGRGGIEVVIDAARDGRLRVEGTVTRSLGAPLGLMPVPGVVRLGSDDLSVVDGIRLDARTFWVNGTSLALVEAPRTTRAGDLVLGEVALGLTVGDTEVRGQAHLRWRITRGRRTGVSFTLPRAGADLEITGPQVASWERRGDRIEIALNEPETALVSVSARWSSPLARGDEVTVTAPVAELADTFRTTHTLQIARDSTHEVVPTVGGFQSVPASTLPSWAQGLVQGRTTASYASDQTPRAALQVLRVAPAQGPSTLVDVASYRVATTAEGRVMMRAHYAVRNDRGARLALRPPPGMEVVAARVAGSTAKLARDGDSVLVPLARSVETLEGLLTFAVEVTLLGEGPAWRPRGEHAIPLPVIDAPIAVSRATVFLPPERRPRAPTSSRIVDAFTEGGGITYGFAAGDARAAQADVLFQSAVSSWMANDFDEAQEAIDDLRSLGADNDDVQRLQSNLSYVLGGVTSGVDVAQARRVKEMARARAEDDVLEQEKVLREAEQQYAAGDYDAAEQNYSRALELGSTLERLATEEDVEVRSQNAVVAKKLDATRKRKKVADKDTTTIDFEDVVVSGEIEKPSASLLLDRAIVVEESIELLPEPLVEASEIQVRRTGGSADVSVAQSLPGVTGGKKRPRRAARSRADQNAPAPPPPPPPMTVTAASASVVIPELGEPVLYQRLLLPAGAPDSVPLSVRPRRKR